VIEAWEKARDQLKRGRLLECLERLGWPVRWRRAGVMAEHIGDTELTDALRAIVEQLPPIEEPIRLYGVESMVHLHDHGIILHHGS